MTNQRFTIKKILKRNGTEVSFEKKKIVSAVSRAFLATREGNEKQAKIIADRVCRDLLKLKKAIKNKNFLPDVEMVQDLVEEELILSKFPKTAKAYILYRERHTEFRRTRKGVSEKVKKLAEESRKYFKNTFAEFIYYRTYSRWIETEGRRETWIETVDRYFDFMKGKINKKLNQKEYLELREAVLSQNVMPSMRLLQFAGKAAGATNVCAYNCSYLAPSRLQDFAEILYVLMCGTGLGFSVESQNVQKLSQIKIQRGEKPSVFTVPDSKEGWADALALGMKTWFEGKDVEFDFSNLRPAGARLKTMGGKSSGPEPLRALLEFTRNKILSRQGKRLSNLDVHDIICKIGDCVVSGGVRRSALISLSDLDDQEMRDAKKGQFFINEPQRSLANNSAVYSQKPSNMEFLDEWIALIKSGSGERGIFNRGGLSDTLPARRMDVFKKHPGYIDALGNITGLVGTNPCGEILLQSKQFCNLTEVIARPEDDKESLLKKIRLATILGTYQATLTDFPYLSDQWKKNCQEERLLGVSISGQWDCPAVRDPKVLEAMREESIRVNKKYSSKFGINRSTCITCVKPSGTVSQLVDCASGMHPRHAEFYVRRVRISATDSLFSMLKEQGVPYYPEVGQTMADAHTFVLEFPVKSPKSAVFKNDLSALEQLEYWKVVKKYYTEHNPSVTISVGDDEWLPVAHWIYNNWDLVGGLSFLPRENHVYKLAPYEEIDEKKYLELIKAVENVDFSKISLYEAEDNLDIKKELACVSGVCEIV